MSETNGVKVPDRIGKYRIEGLLGMGGMGVIYKAVQEPLNRVVALKVLPPQFSQDGESSARFETEAKAVSMLQHQNIVQLYEYGIEDGSRYFTMQYIDGESLAERIAARKSMALPKIIDYAKQICRGLRYAHGMDVIHRDIKPQNVLLDSHDVARLSDFGIAKIFSRHSITMTGVTVGTPEYMSPEQAEGLELTGSSDIYSLGILIYEMLAKNPPFLANNPVAVAYKQVHEMPVPPSTKRPDVPKRLELIVLKALKKDPKERYQDVDEMLEHLDSVDVNEKAGRPTVSVKGLKKTTRLSGHREHEEQRITDRRSGGRRVLDRIPDKIPMHRVEYWAHVLYYQWPLMLIVVVLGLILVSHLLNQP